MKDTITKLDNFVFHDVPVEKINFKTIKTTEFCVELSIIKTTVTGNLSSKKFKN